MVDLQLNLIALINHVQNNIFFINFIYDTFFSQNNHCLRPDLIVLSKLITHVIDFYNLIFSILIYMSCIFTPSSYMHINGIYLDKCHSSNLKDRYERLNCIMSHFFLISFSRDLGLFFHVSINHFANIYIHTIISPSNLRIVQVTQTYAYSMWHIYAYTNSREKNYYQIVFEGEK